MYAGCQGLGERESGWYYFMVCAWLGRERGGRGLYIGGGLEEGWGEGLGVIRVRDILGLGWAVGWSWYIFFCCVVQVAEVC